jgi:hypothetical protein
MPGHAHELAVRLIGEPVDHAQRDLALEAAVGLDLLGLEAARLGDRLDRHELRFLCDLQAALHVCRPSGVNG